MGSYTLIWHDEFEGDAGTPPNPDHWTCEIGGSGWGNEEWQYYTDRPENVALDGHSVLVITARQENSGDYECWYGRGTHTSARLVTRGKFEFTHGKVEARIKLPHGQGLWPAFWLLGANYADVGWPECGEIDIMENIGREPRTAYGALHGPGYCGMNPVIDSLTLDHDLAADFHVFGVEWEPALIRWTLDGQEFHRATPESLRWNRWVFDHACFILLNVAVGGRWPGYPDDTTVFPQTMHVDWVRVYQQA